MRAPPTGKGLTRDHTHSTAASLCGHWRLVRGLQATGAAALGYGSRVCPASVRPKGPRPPTLPPLHPPPPRSDPCSSLGPKQSWTKMEATRPLYEGLPPGAGPAGEPQAGSCGRKWLVGRFGDWASHSGSNCRKCPVKPGVKVPSHLPCQRLAPQGAALSGGCVREGGAGLGGGGRAPRVKASGRKGAPSRTAPRHRPSGRCCCPCGAEPPRRLVCCREEPVGRLGL